MTDKNVNKLTLPLPNGGTDSETVQKTPNGGPASSDSLKSTPEPSPPFNSESFARRRASSLSLTPLKIPSPADNQQFGDVSSAKGAAAAVAASDQNVEECAEEGFEHFRDFLMGEIGRHGLQPPPDLEENMQR